MNKLIIVLCSLLLLAGCQTSPVSAPAVVYKNVLKTPPDNLIIDCVVSEPPDIQAYIGSDWNRKEEILFKTSADYLNSIILCNVRMKNLRQWKADQQAIFEKDQKEAK